VLLRRTMLGLDPQLSGDDVVAIAARVQAAAGWDDDRLAVELERHRAERDRGRV
jgi:hypothetical protein